MHTAISCESCRRPLRIPSELVGQTVRCPFCTDTFVAVADASIQLEEAVLNKVAAHVEEMAQQERAVTLLEAEEPIVEESFTVDLEGPVKVAPPKPWATWVFVRSDSDRRLWGEMQAEISAEGLRLYRGRKELIVPIGCEATWISGGRVRVVVGSRTVEFQIKKKHVYKSRLAADVVGFLNGERPMPANKGYRWPWYQWLLLLAPLALIGVLIAGELPETDLKPLKGFGIFMFAFLAPVLAYAVWHLERLPVAVRWTAASLVVGGVFLFSGLMYLLGPNLPPAVPYATWQRHSDPTGRFTIEFPGPFTTDSEFTNAMTVVRYTARVKPKQTFIVAYGDNGQFDPNNVLGSVELGFTRAREYIRTKYPDSWETSPMRPINKDDLQGREWTLTAGRSQQFLSVQAFVVGKRLYILIVSDTIGNNGTRFLQSFKVEGQARNTLPTTPVEMDGLTAYWSFDANRGFDPVQGEVILEDTGNIGSRPLNGCQLTNGRRGMGLEIGKVQFNGYFDYGISPRLNFNERDSFTFAGWFKTMAPSGVLVSQRNSKDKMAIINVEIENGWLNAVVHGDGNNALTSAHLNSRVNIADGKWHHFALLRDDKAVYLYLDGVRQDSRAVAGAKGAITTDLRALGCDLYQQHWGAFLPAFQGSVDEFCIFHRKLNDDEISKLAGKAR